MIDLPLLVTSACDLNSSFNWGQVGTCFNTTQFLGGDLVFILIAFFFILFVLMANFKIGVWYSIAGVLATFFLVAYPGNDAGFFVWIFVIIVLPALMFIPAIQKFVGR